MKKTQRNSGARKLALLFVAGMLSTTVACASQVEEKVGHPFENEAAKGKILMIVANPAVSEKTGWPIGAWASELTHPYFAFESAGYSVDLASPNGGIVAFDDYSDPRHESGYSAADFVTMGFINTPQLMELTKKTKKLSTVSADDYDSIFLVGGQSPMYTFRGNKELMKFVADFYESGKPTAIVCHATALLLDTKLSNGELLAAGKKWTGFSSEEEQFVDQTVGTKIQPFWIEDEARKMKNTNFQVASPWTSYAIRDGNLITGQQQNSGTAAAELVIEALEI